MMDEAIKPMSEALNEPLEKIAKDLSMDDFDGWDNGHKGDHFISETRQ